MTEYTEAFYKNRASRTRLSADKILQIVFAAITAKSVLDLGCATGIWLAACKRNGSTMVVGVDGRWVDRKLLEIAEAEFREHDLGLAAYAPAKKYDLALCIEVAEHLSASMGDQLIASLTLASDRVLFSAAICEQGGTGHINEQPQHYWAGRFAQQGFVPVDLLRPLLWDDDTVNVIYKQNMLLYVKEAAVKALGVSDLVVTSPMELDRVHPDLYAERARELRLMQGSFNVRLVDKIKSIFGAT
ncbi:MAG: class I SAM-dependent methyltransferase [Pseudomonadales bacterium]|nr:class I SAM-dependent methyltransferase [Pseudomonadales bacterium]